MSATDPTTSGATDLSPFPRPRPSLPRICTSTPTRSPPVRPPHAPRADDGNIPGRRAAHRPCRTRVAGEFGVIRGLPLANFPAISYALDCRCARHHAVDAGLGLRNWVIRLRALAPHCRSGVPHGAVWQAAAQELGGVLPPSHQHLTRQCVSCGLRGGSELFIKRSFRTLCSWQKRLRLGCVPGIVQTAILPRPVPH